MSMVLTFLTVVAVMFIVPLAVYGIVNTRVRLNRPTRLPLAGFLGTVLIEKIAVAAAFVGILVLGGTELQSSWFGYALLWFAMFGATEIIEAIRQNLSKAEAAAGIISEAIYFPISGLICWLLLV